MTDLENQLRECLNRHADTATSAPDVEAVTRTRRRRTHRRRQAAAVGAMIPLTAGVVIAATVLPGSTATRGSQAVSVEGSPSPTPAGKSSDTPRVSVVLRPCSHGSRPDVRIEGQARPTTDAVIRSERGYIRITARRYGHRLKNFAGVSKGFVVDAKHATPHEILLETTLAGGDVKWQVAHPGSGKRWTIHDAKLLKCVPSSGSH